MRTEDGANHDSGDHVYAPMPFDLDSDAGYDGELSPGAPMAEVDEERLQLLVARLQAREYELNQRIRGLDVLWRNRLTPLRDDHERVRNEAVQVIHDLEILRNRIDDAPPPPGPPSLRWVEGAFYQFPCSVVILVNLITMGLELWRPEYNADFWVLDQVFLVWYLCEVTLKAILHQRGLLIGRLAVVWWNWLDFLIVVSGILDQWLTPLLEACGAVEKSSKGSGVSASGLRALRLLRFFRLMRILKIVRIFLQSDLTWTEGTIFQTFIMTVIMLNSITMGMELDIPWKGWSWVENVLLVIYVFELAVRLKQDRLRFFVNEDWRWNNLDFCIVLCGILQQCIVPASLKVQSLLSGQPSHSENGELGSLMKLLRMLRLLRIARLARLLKHIKPLYRLMIGVLEAMHGMKWVIILAVILLYASAIVFTNLVGHGLIYGEGRAPEAANRIFGTVPQSMFMLFKVMNDDQSVVEPLIGSLPVKLLFVLFMALSNWALLAILTSVISDNMIAASHRIEKEEEKRVAQEAQDASVRRLMAVFGKIDTDGSGEAAEEEFKDALNDQAIKDELISASGLAVTDLEDLFLCLSYVNEDGTRNVRYADFIAKLQNGDKSASERSILRVEQKLRRMDLQSEDCLANAMQALDLPDRDKGVSPAATAR